MGSINRFIVAIQWQHHCLPTGNDGVHRNGREQLRLCTYRNRVGYGYSNAYYYHKSGHVHHLRGIQPNALRIGRLHLYLEYRCHYRLHYRDARCYHRLYGYR